MYSNSKKIKQRISNLRKIKKSSKKECIKPNIDYLDYLKSKINYYMKKYEKELKYLEDK